MDIDLEIERAAEEIKKQDAKTVLIQLPEGLRPKAAEITKELENTGAEIIIWMGSCFGACDIPDVKGIDLLIQWGHSEWKS